MSLAMFNFYKTRRVEESRYPQVFPSIGNITQTLLSDLSTIPTITDLDSYPYSNDVG